MHVSPSKVSQDLNRLPSKRGLGLYLVMVFIKQVVWCVKHGWVAGVAICYTGSIPALILHGCRVVVLMIKLLDSYLLARALAAATLALH